MISHLLTFTNTNFHFIVLYIFMSVSFVVMHSVNRTAFAMEIEQLN